MGCAAALTTKLRTEEHAATIRNKHDLDTHWLGETLLSSHHDTIPWCYHQRQTHLATMRPWRLPVSHRLQRDCQTSRTIGKRCPTFLLDSRGHNTFKFGHACWQELKRKSTGLCSKCVLLTSLEPLRKQRTATGTKMLAFPAILRSRHYDYTCEYPAMH